MNAAPKPPSEHAFDGVAALYYSWFAPRRSPVAAGWSTYGTEYQLPLGRIVDELEKNLLYRLAEPRLGEHALDVGTGMGLDLPRRSPVAAGWSTYGTEYQSLRCSRWRVVRACQCAGCEETPHPADVMAGWST